MPAWLRTAALLTAMACIALIVLDVFLPAAVILGALAAALYWVPLIPWGGGPDGP